MQRFRALAVSAAAALTLTGCLGQGPATDIVPTTGEAQPSLTEAPGKPSPSTAADAATLDVDPGTSSHPSPTPGQRPPSILDGMAPDQQAAWLADWDGAECAPWSLILDYHKGLLTPEEYTAYSFYAMAPRALPGQLPERYVVCEEEGTLEVLGFAAGIYLEDIDPTFRDELWLELTGQTYEDATRPLTDEEIDEALRWYEQPVEP